MLVHGSAADAEGWTTQLATLRDGFRILVYDRRGSPRSPLPDGVEKWSVGDHAEDLVALVRAELGADPVLAVGSSFGAVCVLEAARRHPDAFRGIVLIEPPLPESDDAPTVPESFVDELERLADAHGGPASAEFFLRTVLGRDAYDRMPARWKERSLALHQAIRLDSWALGHDAPRYADLRNLSIPTLLVGGGRSAPHFTATLRALSRTLPRARLELIPSAGHMLHAEAARTFADLVRGLATELFDADAAD